MKSLYCLGDLDLTFKVISFSGSSSLKNCKISIVRALSSEPVGVSPPASIHTLFGDKKKLIRF